MGHAGVGVRWVIERQDGVGHKNIKILKNIKLLVLQGI